MNHALLMKDTEEDSVTESWLCVDCGINTAPGIPDGPTTRREIEAKGESRATSVPLATLVHCGRPAGGLAVAFPSHVTLVISIINREVPSCELPASCLWSSRCWLSPVLLRPSRATSPTSAG